MKKLITSVIILIFAGGIASGQVPDNLKDQFNSEHPAATAIIWSTVDAGLYKIAYSEKGVKHVVVYDKDMNVVWRRNELATTEVPEPIREYFKSTHPGENYQVLVTDENGKTLYYTSKGDNKTVYLDKEGRVIKTIYESKDYPKNITAYFTKKYPEEKYTVYSEDENGEITYYTVRKGKMLYFDKNGDYIREERYYDYDYEAKP